MTPIDGEPLLGKWVEVSMDSDYSAEVFYGKGRIIHIFSHPPAKEAVAIEFEQTNKGRFRKNKNRYLILQYDLRGRWPGEASLRDTFESGASYATVLRLKKTQALNADTYLPSQTKWVGRAEIYLPGHLGTISYP